MSNAYKIYLVKEYIVPASGIDGHNEIRDVKQIGLELLKEDLNQHVNQQFLSVSNNFFKINASKITHGSPLQKQKRIRFKTSFNSGAVNLLLAQLVQDRFISLYGALDIAKNPSIFDIEKGCLKERYQIEYNSIYDGLITKYNNAIVQYEEEKLLRPMFRTKNLINELIPINDEFDGDSEEESDESQY